MSEHFLVFDIETAGLPYESFSESQREYLVRGAQTDEEREKKISEMALTPLTSQVVCIGMKRVRFSGETLAETDTIALCKDPDCIDEDHRTGTLGDGNKSLYSNERFLLEQFWRIVKKYDPIHLISFNGRNFDAPFLMIRSAVLGVRPSKNIMQGTKFNYSLHTDLIDELTFFQGSAFGATKRFNFDFYTRAFGLVSPKSEGVDGSKVGEYYKAGRIDEIAEYCLRDVNATWELYLLWRKFLKF
jgi:3'-5' exonuclease